MTAIFDRAVAIVLANEGGLVDDPADPGGLTNFGISQRAYPTLDIANLTADDAKAIYQRDYWARYHIGDLPDEISPKVLDTAVLAGPMTAIRLLQRALLTAGSTVLPDGIIGPITIAACIAQRKRMLLSYRAMIAAHYRTIAAANPAERKFLAGWLKRAMA